MWQRFKPFSPTAGFWLLAVAITVSGYQSFPAAIILGALGAACLLIPVRSWFTRNNLRSDQHIDKPALTINFGDSDHYKVVNESDGQRRETVRAIIRTNQTIYNCRLELNILKPKTDEVTLYHLVGGRTIVKGNDFPLDIAHLDIAATGKWSAIMLHRVSTSGKQDNIPLKKDDYTIRLNVSGDGGLLGEKICRLWIDRGTLRLTGPLPFVQMTAT
jgi:hypothetical protein